MSSLSTTELIKVRSTLAHALSVEDVNDLGRTTGQAERLRTVTPHRLFLAIVSTLAGAKVELRCLSGSVCWGRSDGGSRTCSPTPDAPTPSVIIAPAASALG